GGVVIGSDCPCALRPPLKVTQSVTGCMPTRSMGRIGVLEIGAPHPLWNAARGFATTRPLES
ncbi:hypothetical protein, partial [Pseudomonas viridiflava]|uniref:hypothetical protein n=1 Tax=Pseudomonas viridiflava TaxID=33069 RepID=UPI0019D0EE86